VLRPGTAYAAVCGPGAGASSGWTVFCATINDGVNACPPDSIAAGWWKSDGASLCGGKARYIIDCNASCVHCTSGGRTGICNRTCWSCSCDSGLPDTCDQRRICCNAFRYGQCNQDVRQVGGVQCRVVSCTPPWKFEDCSTAPATDNRTVNHNSDRLPQAYTVITRHYISLGEIGSPLGASVYGEFVAGEGFAQRYQSGRISFKSSTGARETVGAIAARYEAVGAEEGPLGFPITGPLALPDGGSFSHFENGRISWSAVTGAWDLRGAVAAKYEALGAEQGQLGYPLSADTPVGDGRGRFARFQRGRISWSPRTGAHVLVTPALRDRYEQLGAETGSLGYQVQDEEFERDSPFKRLGMRGRREAQFQNGTLTYDPLTGSVLLIPGLPRL
jgi:hypothetical protein